MSWRDVVSLDTWFTGTAAAHGVRDAGRDYPREDTFIEVTTLVQPVANSTRFESWKAEGQPAPAALKLSPYELEELKVAETRIDAICEEVERARRGRGAGEHAGRDGLARARAAGAARCAAQRPRRRAQRARRDREGAGRKACAARRARRQGGGRQSHAGRGAARAHRAQHQARVAAVRDQHADLDDRRVRLPLQPRRPLRAGARRAPEASAAPRSGALVA